MNTQLRVFFYGETMRKVKDYTPDQIEEILGYTDIVKTANARSVRFKLGFRQKLYDECYPNFSSGSLRTALCKFGFNDSLLKCQTINKIVLNFKRHGKPKGASNDKFKEYNYSLNIDKSYDDFLLSTGYFVNSRNGITVSNSFFNELVKVSMDSDINDYLTSLGIDLKRFGYMRLYILKGKIDYVLNGGKIKFNKAILYTDEDISLASNNPYINYISNKQIRFKDEFYNEALVFKDNLKLIEILRIFKIDLDFSYSVYNNILYKLADWIDTGTRINDTSDVFIDIQINKFNALTEIVNSASETIKSKIKLLTKNERKDLCVDINKINIPSYLGTRVDLLNLFGISKSSYYSILKNDNYGKFEINKNISDEADFKCIKEVIDYNGYPKGNRMIYMMLPRITKVYMSRNKIRRICKKFGYSTPVRKSNKSRQEAQDRLEKYCKNNLVKRGFRLNKPGKVILTDVSYLPYADTRAYLSATKDACSGRVTLEVSKNNDLALIQKTIDRVDSAIDSIFHSDQGGLYMTDYYQNQLVKKGYTISMSRRGNCWDNAPQESFFGHMKDECKIGECKSFEELEKIIKDYEYYYNYERPQWTRNMMTPVEFEDFINGMNKKTYKKYHANELKKYNAMKERAKRLAITRAKNLGFVDIKCYTNDNNCNSEVKV